MANFDPSAARLSVIFVRRRDPVSPAGANSYVYDKLKFHRIRFDTDTPGEQRQYYEPDSDQSISIQAGGGNAASGVDIATYTPAELIEIADAPPNSDVVQFN